MLRRSCSDTIKERITDDIIDGNGDAIGFNDAAKVC